MSGSDHVLVFKFCFVVVLRTLLSLARQPFPAALLGSFAENITSLIFGRIYGCQVARMLAAGPFRVKGCVNCTDKCSEQ
jgi:hypothetical protein